MEANEACCLEWKERLGQRLGDIRDQIGNSQEKKGAKHKFKMLVDYAVRVSGALFVFFNNVEDLWELAINFALASSGFPEEGNSGNKAMDFACDFEKALDLFGWKAREFMDGAEDNLSNGLNNIDLGIFGCWLRNQRLPEHQILADIGKLRVNGLPQGRDICTTFVGAILRHVDMTFLDWFNNALMNEGSPDRIQFRDWRFQDSRHLVSHAVKHGTTMALPSIQAYYNAALEMIVLSGQVEELPEGPFNHGDYFGKVQLVRGNITNIGITSKVDRKVITLAKDENMKRIKTFYTANCEPFKEGTYDIVKAERLGEYA